MKEEEKVELEKQLLALRKIVSDLAREIEPLDKELAPVWRAERGTRMMIAASHNQITHHTEIDDEGGEVDKQMIVYCPFTVEARNPLFEQLSDIAEAYGPMKAERTELAQRSRAYLKEIKRMEGDLKRYRRRKRRGRGYQGSLF